MTPKAAIRQSDLQRIFRAAKAAGCTVTIDLVSMALTVHPYAVESLPIQRGTKRSDLDALNADDFATFTDWQEWRERLRAVENAEAKQTADLKSRQRGILAANVKRKSKAS